MVAAAVLVLCVTVDLSCAVWLPFAAERSETQRRSITHQHDQTSALAAYTAIRHTAYSACCHPSVLSIQRRQPSRLDCPTLPRPLLRSNAFLPFQSSFLSSSSHSSVVSMAAAVKRGTHSEQIIRLHYQPRRKYSSARRLSISCLSLRHFSSRYRPALLPPAFCLLPLLHGACIEVVPGCRAWPVKPFVMCRRGHFRALSCDRSSSLAAYLCVQAVVECPATSSRPHSLSP